MCVLCISLNLQQETEQTATGERERERERGGGGGERERERKSVLVTKEYKKKKTWDIEQTTHRGGSATEASCKMCNRQANIFSGWSIPNVIRQKKMTSLRLTMHWHDCIQVEILYSMKFSSAKKFRQKWPSGSSSGIYFRQSSAVARLLLWKKLVKKLLWRRRRN